MVNWNIVSRKKVFTHLYRRKKKGFRLAFKSYWQLYVLVLPAVLYFLVFNYLPLYGIQIAFKDFKPALGIMGSKWVGMKNFITFFKSYQFSVTIKNTIVISLYTIAVTFPLPIIMALMVNQIRSMKFKKFLQVLICRISFQSLLCLV